MLATRNAGKVAELRSLLAGGPFALESLLDHPAAPEVEETGDSYRANALAKAHAAARATGLAALADDSGLEVDALDGAPGLHSARFSGGGAADNVALLLDRLRGVPESARTARFRCVLALVEPTGAELVVEATYEGSIATAARGARGFGYDPVFVDADSGRTLAELTPEAKNAISHRARACAALLRAVGARKRA